MHKSNLVPIFSDQEADSILKNTPKTTTQPVASMTPGADALKSPGGSMKDIVSQGVRTDLGQNPAGVTAVKTSEPWIKQAVSDMPEGPMKEIGQSFGAPAADAAADAAAGGTLETIKNAAGNMNPLLLGGLAAGGGLLAGKMLGGKKKSKEEEAEDVRAGINSSSSEMRLSPFERQMTTAPNAAQKVSTAVGAPVPGAATTGVATNAAAAMPEVAKTAGAETAKAGIGSTFGDLASKAGEFVSNMHPAAKLGLAAGGGYLASKMIDDDEEEGGNNVSKTLEYSRNEISSRLTNALSSLEEFDIKKARAVLKNLINDL
jgi:hypothetical protein